MTLKVHISERKPGTLTAKLEGRLDGQTYPDCQKLFDAHLAEHIRFVSLDLEKLDYISSVGIRLLLVLRKTLEARGGKLVMANLQPPVQKVMDIANVMPGWGIFASLAEADRYFDKMQHPDE